jgi:hypothetical protein
MRGRWMSKALGALGFASLVAYGVACVIPEDDYDEFLARPSKAAGAGGAAGTGGASGAAGAAVGMYEMACQELLGSANLSGKFYGACLPTIAQGDVTQAMYIRLVGSVEVAMDKKSGVLTTEVTAVRLNATSVDDVVGVTTPSPPAEVKTDCTFVATAAELLVPKEASPLKANLTLTNAVYRGRFIDADHACAELDATVTKPITVDLTGPGDVCLFRRAPDDGTITQFTIAEFNAGCPDVPPSPTP